MSENINYLPVLDVRNGVAVTAIEVFDDTQRRLIATLIDEEQASQPDADEAARNEAWQHAVTTKLLDLSPASRRAYRHEVDRWTSFLALADLHPVDAQVIHARAYARYLDESLGLAPSSTARALAALSGIYRDVDANHPGLTAGNPFANVRRPTVSAVSSTASLTVEEARTFVAAAKTVSPRAYALALLLLTTGSRISEVLTANTRDLVTKGGQTALKVTRKGNRTAHIGVPDPVVTAIAAYTRTRPRSSRRSVVRRLGSHRIHAGPLFTGHRGGPLTASEARREIQRICRAAGWDPSAVTAHGLRHSFATTAVEAAGVPVRKVQHALGHASPLTTERYLHDDRYAATVNTAVAEQLLIDSSGETDAR